MKSYIIRFAAVFALLCAPVRAEGLAELAGKIAESIREQLLFQQGTALSITGFENYSELTPLALQRFYQLIASRLESAGFDFKDTLLDMRQQKGVFNNSRVHQANCLIYLRLLRNKERLGVGMALFSRTLDRILTIAYHEALVPLPELLTIREADFGFRSSGFARVFEIPVRKGLLDLALFDPKDGSAAHYLFFYADEIIAYEQEGKSLVPRDSFTLSWSRPYYPAQQNAGRLTVFSWNGELLLFAGSNFSPQSIVFKQVDGKWLEKTRIPFVPFAVQTVNQQDYLVGAAYATGRNYFLGNLHFLGMDSVDPAMAQAYRKEIPEFFNVVYAGRDPENKAWHLIGKDCQWSVFSADFAPLETFNIRSGQALDVLEDHWLALSDFSRKRDKVFFYDISAGGRRLVYESDIDGEIAFIRANIWNNRPGFWLLIEKDEDEAFQWLQFWSNEK